MSTEQESIFCQEMDVLGDNLEGKSGTFTSLCVSGMTSELDKRPRLVFLESGTRIKCITEHESFRFVILVIENTGIRQNKTVAE